MLPLGKYLTVLPPPQAYKSWNSGKISDTGVWRCLWGGEESKKLDTLWFFQICSKNFCPFSVLSKPHAKVSRNCGSIISDFIITVPHDKLVYPPKIYLTTLIIVTVGPLSSHREWNVLEALPSTDARQQRFQTEVFLCSTATSQLRNEVKWFLLFPTITESSKPDDKFSRKQYSIWRFKNKFCPGQEE